MGQAKKRKEEIQILKANSRRIVTALNFENNIVVSETIDKKKDGFSVILDENAKLLSVTEYKNDELNGASSMYLKNGLFREVAEFSNGKKNGVTVSLLGKNLMLAFFENDVAILEKAKVYELDTNLSIEAKNKLAIELYHSNETVTTNIEQSRLISLLGYHDPKDLKNIIKKMANK